MANNEEASPICRGKNLSWETVLLFYNNMPKTSMPKAEFHSYIESRITGWTQTHSQIARQLAFYYEDNGICYPRFNSATTYVELFMYMQNWASKYFIPNPYSPSLRGKEPVCIYSFLKDAISKGITNFDAALDSIFDVKLSSHDKVNVYLSNFTDILIDNKHSMSINKSIVFPEVLQESLVEYSVDGKKYFDYFTDKGTVIKKCVSNNKKCKLQQIYYGAPGTGKSHNIDELVDKDNSIRTTFHPDSDYASFVGCYKPIAKSVDSKGLYTQEELVNELKELQESETYPCHKFGAIYCKSLDELNTGEIKDILRACDIQESMYTEVYKGMKVGKMFLEKINDSEITYDFVPQAFTTAYVEAWKNTSRPYYLVIEEINRGNCAQIFGDIFQLLDRGEDGMSSYEIKPDTDLEQYLAKTFAEENIEEVNIKSGIVMRLPSNLHILATMNTSDQSLFPIDSAFKRRWEWKYIPIKNEGKNHKIVVGDATYDWWEFISVVNKCIEDVTDSEDKQIGYWFAKADKYNKISAETLVSKVIFYLWNDVFKDYTQNTNSLFKTDKRKYKFREFYNDNGDVKIDLLNEFLTELGLKNETPQSEETQPTEE